MSLKYAIFLCLYLYGAIGCQCEYFHFFSGNNTSSDFEIALTLVLMLDIFFCFVSDLVFKIQLRLR